MSGAARKRSGWARIARGALLAIAFSFALGFGIGMWLRCALEEPESYLAERPSHSTSATPARWFSRRAITKSRSESRLM